MGVKKLPTVKSLQVEFADLLTAKKEAYAELKKFEMSCEIFLYTRQITRNCVILRNERNAKKKSTVVNNNRASLASERYVATDEICVKGVRGCFPDKRFISSCFGRGL